ncbi:DEAD/DEAH box helicase [Metabacillus iocasae]|uniref:Competence protein ComFA n=1 Tax=Priestia iocasae TaxID=2291674 RepID=A0ABS2QY96_9BACI|nr:DEAD/DEAH box helicase [Metabacillus iocasae]MBM7704459.1 competence protein ComFA [Metabacillus iocasae]
MKFYVENEHLMNHQKGKPISHCSPWTSPPLNPTFSYSSELQHLLVGKQLLIDDIPLLVETIHDHYQNGYVSYRKGIVHKPTMMCNRCGNKHLFYSFHCARCDQVCTYCRACIMMGRVSECTPLISWNGPTIPHSESTSFLAWKGTLSPAQQLAASEVVSAIHHNEELLVWAVCGAGKTEVLFEGIHTALQEGKRVCIATPRTDVVLELVPRLQQAFPHANAIGLYGGSPDRHVYSPLVLTTTHQLFRFYQAFDVIIVDEVDAFPYSADETLQYAVQQAKKPHATTIYLTATPNEKWQQDVKAKKRKTVRIPARYHRHPIPVPSLCWCGNWQKSLKKGRLPVPFKQWLQKRITEVTPCFIFIPRIDVLNQVVALIREMGVSVDGVHAADEHRKEKVEQFRKGELSVLVTTTILERGVTVPRIDVAILGAEDRIFTESALVQIAGRVGRSAEYPTGESTFFHYGKTNEMLKARAHIITMNVEAKKRGLIDG